MYLHRYGEEVREERKVGHLNLSDGDTARLSVTLEALTLLLPPEYISGATRAQSKLK